MTSESIKSEVEPKATRYDAKLDVFEKLQVLVWFKYLLNRTGTYVTDEKGKISTKKFAEWIQSNELSSVLPLESFRWSEYIQGKRRPSELMLSNMDKIIPGSSIVYLNGDESLPLWSVLRAFTIDWTKNSYAEDRLTEVKSAPTEIEKPLDKKTKNKISNQLTRDKDKAEEAERFQIAIYDVCERLVNEVLGELGGAPNSKWDVNRKCFTLLNLVLNKALILDPSRNYIDESCGPIAGFFTREEVIVMSPNKVAESYELAREELRVRLLDEDSFLFRHAFFKQRKLLNKNVVLAIVALGYLCIINKVSLETSNTINYMIDGITEKAVTDLFGIDVNRYIKLELG